MKKSILIILLLISNLVFSQTAGELVGIHTANTTTINGIVAPNLGSLIYNTDSSALFVYNGTTWKRVSGNPQNGYNVFFGVVGDSILLVDSLQTFKIAKKDIFDSTSMSNRINNKLTTTDTTAMLLPYLRKANQIDTASLSNRINIEKQRITDTASVHRTLINTKVSFADTAAMLAPYLRDADTASLSNRINSKLATTDTTAMLLPYLRKANQIDTASLSNRINIEKQRITDTASVHRTLIKTKVSFADTAAMLAPYLRDADTASLSNRINSKLNVTDTATMLSKYLRKADTTSLSTRINQKLNISDTAAMLAPYLRDTDTASLSNRINSKLNVTDTATMLSKYLRKVDTTSLSARINQKLNISDTATMLTPYLRKSDTASMLSPYIREAANGLTETAQIVRLGGALTQATTITTTATNTLAVAGLQSGASTDSILVINPATNVIKMKAPLGAVTTIATTTSQAQTGASMANVNTLQFSMLANKKYRVKIYLVYSTSSAGNGIRLAMNSITGNTWYAMAIPTSTAGANRSFSGFNNTSINVGNSSPATTNNVASIDATIHTTSTGTFSFQFGTEVSGQTITIQANSILEYEIIE